uniref:RETST reductase n=1 Tax=Anas platyrhynchos platyrhynchos TaxID=8840 RepID=A0A493TRE9_ANAPP
MWVRTPPPCPGGPCCLKSLSPCAPVAVLQGCRVRVCSVCMQRVFAVLAHTCGVCACIVCTVCVPAVCASHALCACTCSACLQPAPGRYVQCMCAVSVVFVVQALAQCMQALFVHSTCSRSVCVKHLWYFCAVPTVCTQCVLLCVQCVQYAHMHAVCSILAAHTMFARSVYAMHGMLCTLHAAFACAGCANCLHSACTLCLQSVHAVCSTCMRCTHMQCACIQHAIYMHHACVHAACVPCLLPTSPSRKPQHFNLPPATPGDSHRMSPRWAQPCPLHPVGADPLEPAGIHYVGQMHEGSMLRVALDQLTDGQLRWQRLPDPYDEVTLGPHRYQLRAGKATFAAALEEQFPTEKEAIREFMRLSKMASRHVALLALLKLVPRWLAALLLRTGLVHRISPVFRMAATGHSEAVARLTADQDLRALLSYLFYGTAPRDSSFLINVLMVHHYQRGACGTAVGVAVQKGPSEEEVEIWAPVVISDAGIFNTFGKLLPPPLRSLPDVRSRLAMVRHGMGSFLVFVGLRGSAAELALPATNFWIYPHNDLDTMMTRYAALHRDDVPENLAMMFITFPAAKDPTYEERHPGRSCMTILTMARYEWFEEWAGTRAKHRGAEYQRYKGAIAQRLLERALQRFPQLRDKVAGGRGAAPGNGGVVVVGMGRAMGLGGTRGWGAPSEVGCLHRVGCTVGMWAHVGMGALWGLGVLWEWGGCWEGGAPWEWGVLWGL